MPCHKGSPSSSRPQSLEHRSWAPAPTMVLRPLQPQLMGFHPHDKETAGSTRHKHKGNTSRKASPPADAEPCHPITAPQPNPRSQGRA